MSNSESLNTAGESGTNQSIKPITDAMMLEQAAYEQQLNLRRELNERRRKVIFRTRKYLEDKPKK